MNKISINKLWKAVKYNTKLWISAIVEYCKYSG